MEWFKYHGAGNDFLVADARNCTSDLSEEQVRRLCDRHCGIGADGIMLLKNSDKGDFGMVYYNSDGSGGMMCGNGGRCIVAFAADRGIGHFRFEAPDGMHEAELLSSEGNVKVVRLKMKDVGGVQQLSPDAFFLDTGTRHYVRFVQDLALFDVVAEGRRVRQDARFAPQGANANFVENKGGVLWVRTYEKGVEDETLACGTGVVASAIAAYLHGEREDYSEDGCVSYRLQARISPLTVDFVPSGHGGNFAAREVWLTGPAEYVCSVEIDL